MSRFSFEWMTEKEVYREYSDIFECYDVERLAMEGVISSCLIDEGIYVYSRSDIKDVISNIDWEKEDKENE